MTEMTGVAVGPAAVLPRTAARGEAPARAQGSWAAQYARRLVLTDAAVIAAAVFGTQVVWLDSGAGHVAGAEAVSYSTLSIALVIAWLVGLTAYGTRSVRVAGYGSTEYRLILRCTFILFGGVAMISYLLGADISRGYVLIAFPLGLALLLLTRVGWRHWLAGRRRRGEMVSRVVLVGDAVANERIRAELDRNPDAGYVVVDSRDVQGEDAPDGSRASGLGDLDALLERTGADTIIVSGESGLPAQRVREISWDLERRHPQLIVAPNLTGIGGTRIHTRPVAGLPLVHVEKPAYSGWQAFVKRTFDIVGSGLLLVLLSPVFLVVALLVKSSSPGPVFYRQERIGVNGEPFGMLKFRSMREGADAELASLLDAQGTADEPLFKVRDDPRITPVGRVLRKYSIDELPQLVNVLLGHMSLVGPRPQREAEVALYDDAARRRLNVKPGMSGLWQVSGRSALSWDDAIRLDLYYVENWSVVGDIGILLRTFRAVFSPGETAH